MAGDPHEEERMGHCNYKSRSGAKHVAAGSQGQAAAPATAYSSLPFIHSLLLFSSVPIRKPS